MESSDDLSRQSEEIRSEFQWFIESVRAAWVQAAPAHCGCSPSFFASAV